MLQAQDTGERESENILGQGECIPGREFIRGGRLFSPHTHTHEIMLRESDAEGEPEEAEVVPA